MKLIVTIDTEEDNWDNYSPTNYTLDNVDMIPSLQLLFDDLNVKPTYLITYPVATDKTAISLLKGILEEGRCEIGAHCHPWNTPPFEEEINEKNSMLCNLPTELQYKKLSFLHQAIKKHFNIEPESFRSGRWGYNKDVAKNLYKLGYKIDTSITPYTDWTKYYGPDFLNISPQPYKFSSDNIFFESSNGHLVEIPVTIGFLQQNFTLSNYLMKILRIRPISKLRLIGIMSRLNLLNKVWLSPEVCDSKEMIKLAQIFMRKNYKFINMTFHSSSLKYGLTPFVQTKEEEKRFLERIREFLIFTQDAGIESIKLSDSLSLFC